VVVVWGEEADDAQRRWYSVALDGTFAPRAEPTLLANAPAEIDLVAIRPLATKAAASFVLLQTSRDFSGARVEALALELDGRKRGGPALLAQSLPSVVWVDAVPTSTGGLALWAVPRDGSADLFAVPLGLSGEPGGTPQKVLGDVTAWQVAALDDGAAVGAVMAGKVRGEPGPVALVLLEASGKPGPRQAVSDKATADADLDMIRLGTQLVFAWSDRRDLEPRIFGAATDLTGRVTRAPSALVSPLFLEEIVPHTDFIIRHWAFRWKRMECQFFYA
jgi:hypothetical protein